MYGKIFDSMYAGTLYGKWEAIITLQQMIVLCDADGIVDMTVEGLAGRTSIPVDILKKGIEVLSKPDPQSRTPGADGRRIELIDEHRPWGWHIVNHSKYRNLRDADTIRAQTRERVAKHRARNADVTRGNASKRHTNTDTSTTLGSATPVHDYFEVAWVLYPKRSGNNPKADALRCWNARIKDGVDPEQMSLGVTRYARWCKHTGKVGTEHVMQASRFFGPSKIYEQDFAVPQAEKGLVI
jgi:hypothetical protein